MDQTPTTLFDSYEQDFRHIISGISDKLEGGGKNLVGGMLCVRSCTVSTSSHSSTLEQRKAALRRVEIELDEADDIVCSLSCVFGVGILS